MLQSLNQNRKSLSADELETQLILKDLQLRSLFNITQAINDNISISALYNMYRDFISWEMDVDKMILFSKEDDQWNAVCELNAKEEALDKELIQEISQYRNLHTIKAGDSEKLQPFEIIIPVLHKEQQIACALIGEFKNNKEIHTRIQFIRAITNIVSVAIENKKLFNKALKQNLIQRDLELASSVQKWLLPQELPTRYNVNTAFLYKPHYDVGGDYFDYLPYDPDSIIVCISDISGKGVSAALLMSNLQAQLKSIMHMHDSLSDLIRDLNRRIEHITKADKFLTFFVARINFAKSTIRYVNAGHNPPILFKDNEQIDLDKGCIVLGALNTIEEVEVGEVEFTKGDLLLMYTDGLIDIKNNENEYFDRNKLKAFVSKRRNLSAAELIAQLDHHIEEYKEDKEFPDDIAILSVKFDSQD